MAGTQNLDIAMAKKIVDPKKPGATVKMPPKTAPVAPTLSESPTPEPSPVKRERSAAAPPPANAERPTATPTSARAEGPATTTAATGAEKPATSPTSAMVKKTAATPMSAMSGEPATKPAPVKGEEPATKPAPVKGENLAPPPSAEPAPKPAPSKREGTATNPPPLAIDTSELLATAPSIELAGEPESAPAQPATVPPELQPPTPEREEEEPESVHILEPYPEQPDTSQAPSPHVYHGPSLYIVQITPEMAPVAKVGGLGDVVFGLTRELAIRGNHVEIILPKYDNLRYDHIFELHVAFQDLWVPWYEGAIHCSVYFGFVHDRKCFFIEPHSQDNFFNRGAIYGFNDDLLRYAFFSRAAMEFMFKSGKQPDIIHCHDWQTALVPVFLYEIYQHLGMTHPRVCLTIHNFKHQGVTGQELLRATGLGRPEHFFDYSRLRDNHNPHALNLLKGGIVYANFTTTVSPRYAFETRDGGQGFGLEPTLHSHHLKYGGVVNGIDYDVWNPEVDRYLPVRFGLDTLDGKYDNKRALRHRFMLADNAKPIVAFIGRLDPQKGLELVRHAIFYCLEHGAQFVLLGSSPDARINADFWGLKQMLNDSPDCHLEIGYDEELSHLIYAGADLLLVPSQFEPCGLTQLIALRYGTIPVVRAVGGLADTVFDKDYSHRPLHERNGYVFDNYDHPGLESALGRAIACYYHHPVHFRELMKNAMRSDYSWNIPGIDYLNIYNYIRNK